jgi:hypothetical protein
MDRVTVLVHGSAEVLSPPLAGLAGDGDFPPGEGETLDVSEALSQECCYSQTA